MALPKISDVRGLSDEELSTEVVSVKRQLFQLRIQQAARPDDSKPKPHQFKHLRHRLAQLMTVEQERQVSSSEGVPEPEKAVVVDE